MAENRDLGLSLDEIFKALEAELEAADQPPPGAFCVYDYAAARELGRGAARAKIAKMLEQKLIRYCGDWHQKKYYERVSDEPTS